MVDVDVDEDEEGANGKGMGRGRVSAWRVLRCAAVGRAVGRGCGVMMWGVCGVARRCSASLVSLPTIHQRVPHPSSCLRLRPRLGPRLGPRLRLRLARLAVQADIILQGVSRPVDLTCREDLVNAVTTCLSSKVVSQNSDTISPISVDAVLSVIDADTATNVDLNDIKIVKQIGGTIDDTELINGLVFDKGAKKTAGGPTHVKDAKIGLIQFCLSAPKSDMENNVVVSQGAHACEGVRGGGMRRGGRGERRGWCDGKRRVRLLLVVCCWRCRHLQLVRRFWPSPLPPSSCVSVRCVMVCRVMSCRVLSSYPILSCCVLSCPLLASPGLSWRVVSCRSYDDTWYPMAVPD